MRAGAVSENIRLAFEALRVSKLRSSLTILGVVIGVATVMAMAAIVDGIRNQIVTTIEVAGPTTFYVLKKFSQTPLNPDNLPKEVRIRPDLAEREAERLRRLPEVAYASLWGQTLARIESEGTRSQSMAIFGADDGFTRIQGGELVEGRWFTRNELSAGTAVVVLQEETARRLFGRERMLGRLVRIGGRPLEVIGLWQEPGNIFAPPGQSVGAVVPYRFLERSFPIDKTNALWIPVKPRAGVSVAEAQGAAVMALREMRGLRPGSMNSFDLVTQDQILDTFNGITSVFFLVMIVLSGVALLVGGIGVMAIMTVSVTSRTREIGVRKALGATRRDILLQFLIEACTLTGIGGVIGILVGLAMGRAASFALDVTAPVPVTLTIIAVVVSVGIGIVFGMVPARRAARLDPIEALRYE
ncbi:MAG: ABC transporter permease [Gemmatimonadota bacterium]|nr:ABC transporter permease [Gemmatimonadota bacterium]MDQ8166600.1 ABC transporter permease [Gemmatimonadota bacterium]